MKKLTAVLLALLMLVPSLASCSEQTADETDNKAQNNAPSAEAGGENAPEETEFIDPFADTDFGGRDFRVYTSVDTSDATNGDAFIRGSGETTGEIVNDAVFDRNLYVSETLNIGLKFTECTYTYSNADAELKKLVMAGTDEYDVIVNDIRTLANLSRDGYVRNVYGSGILDLDQQYWYSDAMRDLQFIEGGMYLLIGDYFTDALSGCHVLYHNKSMLNDYFGSENYINDIVFDGKWTFDAMTDIVNTTVSDLNGDGQMTEGDLFGFTCIGTWGSMIPALIGTGIQFVERGDSGIQYCFNNERSITILEKLNKLYWANGSLTNIADYSSAGLRQVFANNQTLIMGYNRLGDLANMRDIEFGVGILPYPKLDDLQAAYVTSMHDISEVGMIPATVPTENVDFVHTCLEVLCRETGRKVIPVYYEEALKVKYANGQDDARMIDLIHDTICSPFAVAYDNALGGFMLSICFSTPLGAKNADFASAYKKGEKAANKNLEKTYEKFANCLLGGN